MVISLTAKGLTSGEIQAHLAETYGTDVSRETISRITDRVLDDLAHWANRPLDRVYPVVFIDAIVVKIRDDALRSGVGVAPWQRLRVGDQGVPSLRLPCQRSE